MSDGTTGRWKDLSVRVISAGVLMAVAVAALLIHPYGFGTVVALASGIMTWELARMLSPRAPWVPLALGGLVAGFAMAYMVYGWRIFYRALEPDPVLDVPLVVIAPVVALAVVAGCRNRRIAGAAYAAAIAVVGVFLAAIPPAYALPILIVVALTDIAGYFAGKALGGRKFWPSISPRKTWAGIVAGWVASAFVAVVWGVLSGDLAVLVVIAIGMSFASQMGDIVESAFKRAAGVKDASNLIPGHGGFLDRFDGVVGATLALALGALLLEGV